MKRTTLQQRFLDLFRNGELSISTKTTITLDDLKSLWKSSWHKKDGLYREYRLNHLLFDNSFMRNVVRPLTNDGFLKRVDVGVYQPTKKLKSLV